MMKHITWKLQSKYVTENEFSGFCTKLGGSVAFDIICFKLHVGF